jgi:hypothetical protein
MLSGLPTLSKQPRRSLRRVGKGREAFDADEDVQIELALSAWKTNQSSDIG